MLAPNGVIMSSVRDIRVRDSRNWRSGAGAHSMIDDAAGIGEDVQAIGKKGEPPSRQKKMGRGGQKRGNKIRRASEVETEAG
jgi:hypothetical protein